MTIDLLFHFIWRWLLLFFLLSLALLLFYQLLAWLRNSKGQCNRKALLHLFSIETSLEGSALHSSFKRLQTSPWLDGKFKKMAWLCPQWSTQLTTTPSSKELKLCIDDYLNDTKSLAANWPPQIMTIQHHSLVSAPEEVCHYLDEALEKQWQATKRVHLLWLSLVLVVLFNIDGIKITQNLWQQTQSSCNKAECLTVNSSFSETMYSIGIGWENQSSSYYLQALVWPEPLQNIKNSVNEKFCGCEIEQAPQTQAPPAHHVGWLIAALFIFSTMSITTKIFNNAHNKIKRINLGD